MNKKLASVILASSIFASSSAFGAAKPVVKYNPGQYSFTFENTEYKDSKLLTAAIENYAKDPANNITNPEEFEPDFDFLSGAKLASLLEDVFINEDPSKENFLQSLSGVSENLVGEDVTVDELNKSIAGIKTAIKNGLTEEEQIKDLFVTAAAEEDTKDMFQKLGTAFEAFDLAAKNNTKKFADEFGKVIKSTLVKVGKKEDELDIIHEEIDNLQTQLNTESKKTNADANVIKDLTDKIAKKEQEGVVLTGLIKADPEFIVARNSRENQELLKQLINKDDFVDLANLPEALKQKFNDILEEEFIGSAESKEELSMFLEDEPGSVNVGDLPSVQRPDSQTSRSVLNNSLINSGILSDRINVIRGVRFGSAAGVAAGDPFETYGAWIKGTISSGTQKAFDRETGYKFSQKGATIGFDTGDESMLGLAYSFFKSDVTNKTDSETKNDSNSHIFNVYGMHSFSPEVFLAGQVGYGRSSIKKKRDTGDLAGNIASAKTKANIVNGKLEVGYVYAMGAMEVTPTIGGAINHVKVDGYKETGNGLNREVGKSDANRDSLIGGVSFKYNSDMSGMNLVPELHANVDYAFSTKSSDTKILIGDGFDYTIPSEKISKGYYNVGGSVSLLFGAGDSVDVNIGYDLGLSKKFMSHTGSFKLRVNF